MIQAKQIHLIGVGGIGVSAAAKWWKAQGAEVTGSDMHPSEIIDDLEKEGIQVKIGHFADNLPRECDLVIYSAAVPSTNVERQAAAERGITEWSYAQFLGEMAKGHKTIAISGTNGKSTTTAMIGTILAEAGLDPTVIVGTMVPSFNHKNLRFGKGDWFVVEACEHMANMLNIAPNIAVITNIEEDHLDFYRDINHIRETFQQWADMAKDGVVINARDPESQKIRAKKMVPFASADRKIEKGKQTFTVDSHELELMIPGEFNAMNAAAAAKAAELAGVQFDQIRSGLATFKGTWRRFEHVGTWKDADVYSDYGHHPTAIRGTLAAFKEFFPDRRLMLVFEPHQYSRTAELFDDFVPSFELADVLILSEVYQVAGRNEFAGKTSKDLVAAIKKLGKPNEVHYAENLDKAENVIRDNVKSNDVIVIMGAGAVDSLARKLV